MAGEYPDGSCKHGLKAGCAYCHSRTVVAGWTSAQGRRIDRIVKYAGDVALAMDRRGPLRMVWKPEPGPLRGMTR